MCERFKIRRDFWDEVWIFYNLLSVEIGIYLRNYELFYLVLEEGLLEFKNGWKLILGNFFK